MRERRRLEGLLTILVALGAISTAHAQAVPDSIAAEGVPALPRALLDALATYQHTRTAAFQGWYGGRREILITTRFADTNQVHHVALPGGARTQLTFLAERVLGALPRPGSAQFVFESDEGGGENYQFFLDDPAHGRIDRLSDGRARHVAARWSRSGKLLAWSSNARNGKDMDLYVVAPDGPAPPRRFAEATGSWSVTDWSPDEQRVAVVEYVSINESMIHLVEVASGESVTITPKVAAGAETVSYSDVRWAPDGKALYYLSDAGSDFRRLTRFDLQSERTTVISGESQADTEAFDLSDDGRRLVSTENRDGFSQLALIDVETGTPQPLPALPPGVIADVKFRPGSHEFAFGLDSARAPNDVYSIDPDAGQLHRWTRSETGELPADLFPVAELVRFPSFDGRKIPAFVYKARASKFAGKRPVLIQIHGGPENQVRPGFLGRLNAWVGELGITLILPNVRGSSGYGKTYLKLDNGMRREDSVKDIGALLDWIATQPDLDATRVAVIGGSYGGFMALASLTHYSDRLKAGIDIVGISNFVSFLENTQGYRRDLRRAEYGDERDPEMKRFLVGVSPLSSADKIKVPLLVAQGKNDPRVPASESEQIVAAVKKSGQPVWYVLGKNEGHGFAKKPNLDYLQAVEALFLRRFLLDDEGGTRAR